MIFLKHQWFREKYFTCALCYVDIRYRITTSNKWSCWNTNDLEKNTLFVHCTTLIFVIRSSILTIAWWHKTILWSYILTWKWKKNVALFFFRKLTPENHYTTPWHFKKKLNWCSIATSSEEFNSLVSITLNLQLQPP